MFGGGAKYALSETDKDYDWSDMPEGVRFIIEEAMKEDERPLFIVLQGALTDLALAYLCEPRIVRRCTAVWIGGGRWPEGGYEYNLSQDIKAVNIIFASEIPLWQIPINVYKQIAVSLAELQVRVAPCGEVGRYLFEQMVTFNDQCAGMEWWPPGETWGLGDSAVVTVLLEEQERMNWRLVEAPKIAEDMRYIHGTGYRKIRVYDTVDSRLTLEDFYAKLFLNFGMET